MGDGGQNDYDTIANERLARGVKPSESTWMIEAGDSKELHFSLQKESGYVDPGMGITPYLWDRAFENDEPIDLRYVPNTSGTHNPTTVLLRTMKAEALRLRKRGNDVEAEK